MADTREKLIDIITYYADFLDWERIDSIADTIMEKCFATDNNVGGNWISVDERLPEDGRERVLVFIKGAYHIIGHPDVDTDRFVHGKWVRWNGSVTHWMPLPEPPGADMRGGENAAG